MRRAMRQQRGAASVEAAISMIIIIPVFMYALFLDDLLRYAADVQEAVTSTPWDFATQDYTQAGKKGLASAGGTAPIGGGTAVQHNARLMYCDHESSGDSYVDSQDCDEQDHHKALSGHVCWLNGEAHQVTCETVNQAVGDLGDADYQRYKSAFNVGGLYHCHAKAVVENYLMPETFLQEFSQVDMAKQNWKGEGGDIHDNATKGTIKTAYYIKQHDFALITDTWALNDSPASGVNLKVEPGTKSGAVYDRVDNVYSGNTLFTAFQAANLAFRGQLTSNQLLMPGVGDDPTSPNISFPGPDEHTQSVDQEGSGQDYFNTPWRSGDDDGYEQTYNNRGKFYMGCEEEESC